MDNNNTTFSEAVYLQTHLGSRYRSHAELLALSVVYAIILITGVVGNLATCVVITWNSHMHTATNYYLFSLAISDTITLVLGKMQLFQTMFRFLLLVLLDLCVVNRQTLLHHGNVAIYTVS